MTENNETANEYEGRNTAILACLVPQAMEDRPIIFNCWVSTEAYLLKTANGDVR